MKNVLQKNTRGEKMKAKTAIVASLVALFSAALLFLVAFAAPPAEETKTEEPAAEVQTVESKDDLKDGLKNGLKDGLKDYLKKGTKDGLKDGLKNGAKNGLKNGARNGLKNGVRNGLKNGVRKG